MKGTRNRTTANGAGETAEKKTEEKILSIAPLAVAEAERILKDPKASMNAQIQVIDLILNRTFGRPEAVLKIGEEEHSPEDTNRRLQDIFESVKKRREANHD